MPYGRPSVHARWVWLYNCLCASYGILYVCYLFIFQTKDIKLAEGKRVLESKTWNSSHEVALKRNKSDCLAKLKPIVKSIGKRLGIYMGPGISALHNFDFGEIFDNIDTGMDGKLSYDDLNAALERQQRELISSSTIFHLKLL
jgi:hypothetical protein